MGGALFFIAIIFASAALVVIGLDHLIEERRVIAAVLITGAVLLTGSILELFDVLKLPLSWHARPAGLAIVAATLLGVAPTVWRDKGRPPFGHWLLGTYTATLAGMFVGEQLDLRVIGNDETTGILFGLCLAVIAIAATVHRHQPRNGETGG